MKESLKKIKSKEKVFTMSVMEVIMKENLKII